MTDTNAAVVAVKPLFGMWEWNVDSDFGMGDFACMWTSVPVVA